MKKNVNDENFREYLSQILFRVPTPKGRRPTLAHVANELGYSSPRTVGMVLRGQRRPSFKLLQLISERYCRDEREKATLQGFAQNGHAHFVAKPVGGEKIDDIHFSLISEWYFLVIKQLAARKNHDPMKIVQALDYKVSLQDVERVLARLKQMGLQKKCIKTENDLPSASIRKFHRQMLLRAIESIDEQGVLDRELQALTLKFNRRDLKRAQARIRKFVEDFNSEFASDPADDVYQLNVQLFSHTKKRGKL